MSSRIAVLLTFGLPVLLAAPLAAQVRPETRIGAEAVVSVEEAEPLIDLHGPPECDSEQVDENTIVVCRELPSPERYMSPLPRKVESDRQIIPGLTDPPCWVQGLGPPACIRFGSVPEPAYMVDFSKLPEALEHEVAEKVSALPDDDTRQRPELTGKRIPIPLGD